MIDDLYQKNAHIFHNKYSNLCVHIGPADEATLDMIIIILLALFTVKFFSLPAIIF